MADERNNMESNDDNVKLFVGQIPKHMTEIQLLTMFKEFAIVDEVNIIKDKTTQASRGCCFLVCPTREEADRTVDSCHNKITLPGASSPLQVKYANGELERLEHKLFVGMLPKNVSETEISALFAKFGNIRELQILRGSPQTSKGCAFLKYEKKEQAIEALDAVNGKHKMEGSNSPLVVKWADTEKDRQARKAQKVHSLPSYVPNANSVHPLFGPLSPMGYVPLYNGYGYQSAGSYGLMPYQLPPVQNHQNLHSTTSKVNQENGSQGNSTEIVPQNLETSSAGYLPSMYQTPPGVRFPLSYPGGEMTKHGPSNVSSNKTSSLVSKYNSGTFLASSSRPSNHVEGPPGANLFVYQIPQDFGDEELEKTFDPFGRVLSTKVFLDKETGISKCFGFVSYDTPAAARSAIDVMNGFQLGGRKLKVQLKRENKLSNSL